MDMADLIVAAPDADRSARQTVEECLARIAAENPKLNAVSVLFAEAALARADILDRAAAEGQPTGRLHGVPVLLKDVIDVAGHPTGFGSKAYAIGPAARNAPVIDRLEAEGAIILGKTTMVEFAVGSWGTNTVQGTPWNPSDATQHRVPGGSSSGAAVSVAAGFAPIAFGSDTGGSIRIPAALCGVVGYKPSFGLIPLQGVAATGASFDTLGPLSMSVAQVRAATEAAAGISLCYPDTSLAGLVLAHVSATALAPIDPVVLAAYRRVLATCEAAGATLREFELPLSFVDLQALNGDIVAYECYQQLSGIVDDQESDIDPYVRKRVQKGALITASAYRARLEKLQATRRTFEQAFCGFDALVLPGTPIPAPTLEQVDESQIPMSRYTRLANCLNLCAITLPIAGTPAPLGIQLADVQGSDAKLLAIAGTLEAEMRKK
jgi:aspartyl-tRNA(Asn)/glutamyl-tRNA(Gln) amidotransferase subunit A